MHGLVSGFQHHPHTERRTYNCPCSSLSDDQKFQREKGARKQSYGKALLQRSISSPNPNGLHSPSNLSLLTEAIREHKRRLESFLYQSGAMVFDVVEAFGFDELHYVGGAAPQTNFVGHVFSTNESSPNQKIPFHHEMAHVPEYPSKLFFFCEVEHGIRGETSIVLSHVVYERMKEKHPKFVDKLEDHGLIYVRLLREKDDPSSPIGRGWKSTFLTKDKNVAEGRAAKLGTKLEWMKDEVKTITGPIPAIKFDKTRERKIWFNSIVIAYTGYKNSRNDPVNAVTFGNGSPLPADDVFDCLRILEEESIAIPWQKEDVLLIDNLVVLHSRRLFNPPHCILATDVFFLEVPSYLSAQKAVFFCCT